MLMLNQYSDDVEFFVLRPCKINGVQRAKGYKLDDARDMKNLEALVRAKRVVPVTADRNLLPKMFLRDIRSVAYCTTKYGFTPELSGLYDPSAHTVPQVLAYAATASQEEITRLIAAETAGLARSTCLDGLEDLLD